MKSRRIVATPPFASADSADTATLLLLYPDPFLPRWSIRALLGLGGWMKKKNAYWGVKEGGGGFSRTAALHKNYTKRRAQSVQSSQCGGVTAPCLGQLGRLVSRKYVVCRATAAMPQRPYCSLETERPDKKCYKGSVECRHELLLQLLASLRVSMSEPLEVGSRDSIWFQRVKNGTKIPYFEIVTYSA